MKYRIFFTDNVRLCGYNRTAHELMCGFRTQALIMNAARPMRPRIEPTPELLNRLKDGQFKCVRG
jgi:hypothetical protein